MIVTLATDYSELRGVLAFPAAVLMYLVSLLVALVVSKRPKNADWWLAVGWGVVFPVAQAMVSAMMDRPHRDWLQALPTSAFTALLLAWATRSWIAPLGCVAGWGASAATGAWLARNDLEWLLAVPWNLCVGASLVGWAVWARAHPRKDLGSEQRGPVRVVPEGMCAGCGCDVSRVKGGVCPECGGAVRAARGE
ncbi:MAG: hypothetical protein QM783_20135 [Phycisphaerales bacterium]